MDFSICGILGQICSPNQTWKKRTTTVFCLCKGSQKWSISNKRKWHLKFSICILSQICKFLPNFEKKKHVLSFLMKSYLCDIKSTQLHFHFWQFYRHSSEGTLNQRVLAWAKIAILRVIPDFYHYISLSISNEINSLEFMSHKVVHAIKWNQRTIGPVNAHLIPRYLGLGFIKISLPRFFQKWPWPSIPSLAQLIVCIYQLSGHRLQCFLKNPLFSIFSIEKPVTKFDLAIK